MRRGDIEELVNKRFKSTLETVTNSNRFLVAEGKVAESSKWSENPLS